MGEIFKFIVQFFFNKGFHFGYRLSMAIFIFLVILFTNDFLGLSRHYILNAQLDQIIRLKQIDPNILRNDSILNIKYLEVKSAIVNDQSKSEKLIEFIRETRNSIKSSTHPNSKVVNNPQAGATRSNKYFDMFDFSAMIYFYVLIFLVVVVLIVMLFNKQTSGKERLSTSMGVIVMVLCIYLLGRLYKLLISFIPLISNAIWINYTINILLPIIVTTILIIRYRKSQAT